MGIILDWHLKENFMDSILMMLLGYLGWCSIAFVVAKMMKIENANHKAISFIYVIMAAPLVLLDYITGKGTIR